MNMLPAGCVTACKGCYHRSLAVEDSLAQKSDWLNKLLAPWASVIAPFHAALESEVLGYRDKICLKALWNEGSWEFGLKRQKEFVSIPDCPVHAPLINQTIAVLKRFLPGPDIFPLHYYIQSGKQLTLVAGTEELPGMRWSDEMFHELIRLGIEGIWLHLNPEAGERVIGRYPWHFLFGKQRSLNKLHLIYGPKSYHQIIPSLYNTLLSLTLKFFGFQNGDSIADLYCGLGGSLVVWTRAGAEAIGIEINGEAVECARMNVSGTLVLRGKCEDRLDQIDEWMQYKEIKRFFIFMNPPKTGVSPSVVNWILQQAKPLRIAYVSTGVKHLKTELPLFAEAGYRVEAIHPFDAYPLTHHIECLVLLQREND